VDNLLFARRGMLWGSLENFAFTIYFSFLLSAFGVKNMNSCVDKRLFYVVKINRIAISLACGKPILLQLGTEYIFINRGTVSYDLLNFFRGFKDCLFSLLLLNVCWGFLNLNI
jgi:hypothetical protein